MAIRWLQNKTKNMVNALWVPHRIKPIEPRSTPTSRRNHRNVDSRYAFGFWFSNRRKVVAKYWDEENPSS